MAPYSVRTLRYLSAALLAASTLYVGCGGSASSANDSGGASNSGGASANGGSAAHSGASIGTPNGSGGGSHGDCRAADQACAMGSECCSGVCDPKAGCVATTSNCSSSGAPCAAPTECCSLSCVNGGCSAASCTSDGQSCSSDAECCGGVCGADKLCTPLNQRCLTAGNGCDNSADCCSGLCDDSKHCSLGASFCIQPGDVCSRDGDCCTGNCTIAVGQQVGACAAPPKGPAYCDKVDGMLCNGCGDCCSRLCAPGPAGVNICQPASGCHVTGDLCKTDLDCCGGDPDSGLPGAGNGKCQLDASGKIGLCINPTNGGGGGACNPEGNVCHYLADAGYACTSSSARADCCGDEKPKWKMCKLDPLGVPRCMGAGECKKAGESCALSADCCDGSPCVPDAVGALHCFDPGGGKACVPSGSSCTINADCCPGGSCHRSTGSIVGTCTTIPDQGGSGGAGGSPSYSGCAEYGQLCQTNGDCCNDIPCTEGICALPVVK